MFTVKTLLQNENNGLLRLIFFSNILISSMTLSMKNVNNILFSILPLKKKVSISLKLVDEDELKC